MTTPRWFYPALVALLLVADTAVLVALITLAR